MVMSTFCGQLAQPDLPFCHHYIEIYYDHASTSDREIVVLLVAHGAVEHLREHEREETRQQKHAHDGEHPRREGAR